MADFCHETVWKRGAYPVTCGGLKRNHCRSKRCDSDFRRSRCGKIHHEYRSSVEPKKEEQGK